MVFQEKATQTEQFKNQDRKYFGLTSKNVLRFASSLILPLMLGIFTVVIAFQQQKLARDQRIEDMQLARQQRLEDKNESRLQREQDRDESRLQREQDKNESQLQREQAWNLAQSAQEAQSKTIRDQYQDEVLVAYIKEIGDLLKEYNGSLTSDPLTHTLARIKTLNTIRQLDGSQKIHVIRFLYEARQLSNTKESIALDISTAELSGIDFHKSGRLLNIGELSLAGVHLVNCTFSSMSLQNVNFSSAERLENLDFSSADLTNVDFSSTWLHNVDFSSAKLHNVSFAPASLDKVNFSSARLSSVDFSSARLESVGFSSADFNIVDFSSALLVNVTFSPAVLENVNFSSAELYNVNFSSVESLENVNFSFARFDNDYGSTRFDHANMVHTIFERCDCHMVDFSYANLKNSSFHSATLSSANFYLADLQDADFTNTTITDSQLQSALSIRDAKLPNGTLGRGRNSVQTVATISK